MKHIIFSIYDNVAKAYIPPFFLPNKAMAIRTFKDCVNSKGHAFNTNPEDYTLYSLGSFDDELGLVTQYTEKEKLGNGQQYVMDYDLDQEPIPENLKRQIG